MRNLFVLATVGSLLVGCAPSEEKGGSNFNRNYQVYAPTDLQISKTPTNIKVQWQTQDNDLEVSYVLQRKLNQPGQTFQDRATIATGDESFTDSQGLQNGKKYFYRLKVTDADAAQEEYSDEVSIVFGDVVIENPIEEDEI